MANRQTKVSSTKKATKAKSGSSFHYKPAKKAKTPKPRKKGYSAAERKAYYMGLGVGMCGVRPDSDEVLDLIDPRQGLGQRKDLCASARAGLIEGYKHMTDLPPFGKDGWFQKRSKKRK